MVELYLNEYYENCSPNYKKIIDSLKELDYMISSKDLSELTGINYKSIGRYLKILLNDEIIEKKVYSPKNKSVRYSLFRLRGNSKIKDDNDDINKINTVNKDNKKETIKTNIKTRIFKPSINELKDELMDEIKKSVFNNNVIQECKTEIIKFLNVIPIREIDKKSLGYKGMTSNQVRNHLIDLLNQMTIFKL
jgi:DNA-binding HxlR family transcriptional regulator